MFYRLHEDMSCCEVDGHWIFLDTQRDRYFRLSSKMERIFVEYITGGNGSEVDLRPLIERNILGPAPSNSQRQYAIPLESPTRSAVEQTPSAKRVPLATLLEIVAIVCSTRLQLATRRLNSVLAGLTARRLAKAPQPPGELSDAEMQHLSRSAALFSTGRVYVPIEPRCLLDSLALVKFLTARGQHANIVFGVTSQPFTAHCWVQAADLVLNDTVGSANAHTPIRVV